MTTQPLKFSPAAAQPLRRSSQCILTALCALTLHGAVQAQATAQSIVVRAKGMLAGNVGPIMEVRANGNTLGQVEVRSTTYTPFSFPVPAGSAPVSSVDVVFKNDGMVNGQDRNLIVETVSANGQALRSTSPGVSYDIGEGSAAFDGINVQAGQEGMWWSGALRFLWAPQSGDGLLSQVHTKGKIPNLQASGPIVISGSNRVIENLKISNPIGPCIDIRENSRNIVIRNNEIGPCLDDGIRIQRASGVTVTHNYIHDTTTVVNKYDPNADAYYPGTHIDGNGIEAEDTQNLTVRFNYIQNITSGLKLSGSQSSNLVFDKNYVVDVHDDRSTAFVSRIGGQMLQVIGMSNGAGTRVTCNVSDQRSPNASSEDHVNFYQSRGTAQSPILIAYNKLLGGSTSMSGTGTQTGDGGGSHIRTYKNNYFNPGSIGASISGGTNISVEANKVFHTDSYRQINPKVWPAAVKVFNNDPAVGGACVNHRVINNKVDTTKPGWGGSHLKLEPSCSSVQVSGNTEGPNPDLNEESLVNERFPECQ